MRTVLLWDTLSACWREVWRPCVDLSDVTNTWSENTVQQTPNDKVQYPRRTEFSTAHVT